MKIYEASLSYQLVSEGKAAVVNKPELVAAYMKDAYEKNPLSETFWVISLNRKNYPSGRTMISLGTLTSSLAHPREVFRAAVLASAAAIVVTHNHPSGDPAPSAADVQVTRQLRDAAKVMDIELLDHVIVGSPEDDPQGLGYYSFRQAGVL